MIASIPHLFLSAADNQTCCILDDTYTYGYIKYHFHKEAQITMIVSGCGVLQLEQNKYPFKKGDVFIIGSNQPHVFIPAEEDENQTVFVHLLFDCELLEPLLTNLPEFESISVLLNKAVSGLKINDMPLKEVYKKMMTLKHISSFEKTIQLMELIYFISTQKKQWTQLATRDTSLEVFEIDDSRLNKVFKYSNEHYSEDILLQQIASIANLSKSAFCKFFKNNTGKSYMTFLCDIRIKEACKKILNTEKRISEVAYETGFQCPVSFNRAFKKTVGTSPSQYKKQNIISVKNKQNEYSVY